MQFGSFQSGFAERALRLSSLADYAVVMMTAAARHDGGAVSAAILAAETGVPLATAQKLSGRLAAAGLLVSARGSAGGFRLARPQAAINLAEIIEAVEGPIAMTACVDEGRHDCVLEGSCRVQPHWSVVNGVVRDALAGVSLASLAAPAPFVLSEVEGRATGGSRTSRTSTSLSANGVLEEGRVL
jgi:FeS assembly SUF system regulator